MLEALEDTTDECRLIDPIVTRWEGWFLGQRTQ